MTKRAPARFRPRSRTQTTAPADAGAGSGLRRTVAGLGLATIASYGGWFYGFGVLVQAIADDTGWTVAALGGSFAAGQLLSGLGAAFGGRLLDRRGGRATFGLGGLGGGVLLATAAAAPSLPVFAVAFALGGALAGSCGFYHVTMAAARRLSPERPAKAIGPLTIWGAFASPIFLPLTAWMIGPLGWRGALGVLAATTAAGMTAAAVLAGGGRATTPTTDAVDVPFASAVRAAWAMPATRALVVMVVGHGVGSGLILAYQVPIMVAAGLPLGVAAVVAGARGFMQLAGRVGLDRVVQRFGTRRPLAFVLLAAVGGTVLLGLSGTVVVAVLYAVVAGAALGAHSPLSGIHASAILPERHLGALMGAVHALGGAAAATGPLLGGVMRSATGTWTPAVIMAGAGFLIAAASMGRKLDSDASLPAVASGGPQGELDPARRADLGIDPVQM